LYFCNTQCRRHSRRRRRFDDDDDGGDGDDVGGGGGAFRDGTELISDRSKTMARHFFSVRKYKRFSPKQII